MEEFGAEFHHIKGTDNIIADALSQLEQKSPSATGDDLGHVAAYCMCALIRDESIDVSEMCFAKTQAAIDFEKFPMRPKLIEEEQQKDRQLRKRVRQNRGDYLTEKVEGYDLVTNGGKIVIPSSLQGRIIAWHHHYLAHPGITRMEATLRSLFIWPDMRKQICQHVG